MAEASDTAPEEQPAAVAVAAEDTACVAALSVSSSVSAPRSVDGEKSRGKARWGQLRVRAAVRESEPCLLDAIRLLKPGARERAGWSLRSSARAEPVAVLLPHAHGPSVG